MKKLIIGAIVGGLLVFVWQTLSWTVLNLHGKEYQYTTAQDSILANLSSHFSDDGQYFMPNVPEGSSMEEMQNLEKKITGKPWAIVSYHKSYEMSMGANIIRGLLTTIFSVILVCWILMKNPNPTFSGTLLSCIFIGVVGYLFIPYSGYIWYKTPGAITNLVDTVVAWGLCGIWLGWWLGRKK